ncbi:MAG: ATP-binding cassette domain-containing protein [Lachnospiraceae bacterium]|nr:ATP-binding cassette domain-containing protein [Lachnospiraceae bacterium]
MKNKKGKNSTKSGTIRSGVKVTRTYLKAFLSPEDWRKYVLALLGYSVTMLYRMLFQSVVLLQIYKTLEGGDVDALFQTCAICGAIVMSYFVIYFLYCVYGDYVFVKQMNKCSAGISEKIHAYPYDRLNEAVSEGEMVNRIEVAGKDLTGVFIDLVRVVLNTVGIYVLFGLFGSSSYLLIGIAVIFAVYGVIRSQIQMKYLKKYEEKKLDAEDAIGEKLHDLIHEVAFSSMFSCRERLFDEYQKTRDESWVYQKKETMLSVYISALASTVNNSLKGVLGVAMMPVFKTGRLTSEGVSSSFNIYDNVCSVVNGYATPIVSLQQEMVGIHRMDEMFEIRERDSLWSVGKPIGEESLIDVAGVDYNISGKTVLKDIQLTVCKGDKIALIGRNGSGKSTLLRVMAGLNHAVKGVVRRSADAKPDSRALSYVPSQTQLYAGTVQENILMAGDGALPGTVSLAELGAEEEGFLQKQTGTLSGGQAQRVNLARGMLRKGAFTLADEPEAGLSAAQGDRIIRNLVENSESLVVVTHYPTHLHYFSRIVLLEDGKIAADGNGHGCLPALEWGSNGNSEAGGSCRLNIIRGVTG